MKTFFDWSAYDTYGIGDAYSGIPATGGNYAKAVAVCILIKTGQCTPLMYLLQPPLDSVHRGWRER